MVEWISVISLIVVGILLIIVEILFVPGTTVVGILGMLAMIFGIYLSYEYFGTTTGLWITTGGSILFIMAVIYGFKSKTWEKFSLKGAIKSKVNEGLTLDLNVGDVGMASSSLRPVGKGEFNDKEYEVKSFGEYVESGTPIKIAKIEVNNIFVEIIKS